jgi:hypothetical protein
LPRQQAGKGKLMDEKASKEEEKRIKEGWIRSKMIIEVLAISESAAELALQRHVEKMGDEDNTLITRTRYHEIQEIEKPAPNVEKAYSKIVDVDVLNKDFDSLVRVVVSYAPSSVEIVEPDKIAMDMGEAQAILNSLSEIIHKFAQAGIGGVMVGT